MSFDEIGGAVIFGGIFLFFTVINYSIIYRARIKHKDAPSLTPLLGGISGAIAMLAVTGMRYPLLLFLPLLVDPGSIPLIIEFIILLISDNLRKKP